MPNSPLNINCVKNPTIIQNLDGTVSVFEQSNILGLIPITLNKYCCLGLNPNYTFDVNTQKCMWTTRQNCSIESVFKIILNPKGNDGAIFNIPSFSGETCVLDIDFDYLFKVNCDTLSNILFNKSSNTPVPFVDATLQSEIKSLEAQIEQQYVTCETISNEISFLQTEIANTQYSINCDPASPTYCLTPNGLLSWAHVLGPVNYNNFLNNDPTSYNCKDVVALVLLNQINIRQNLPILFTQCNTPFGTLTNLKNQLNQEIKLLQDCELTLQSLNDLLTTLKASAATETILTCSKPIDFFETLDVSMTLDVVTSANTLSTVYESNDVHPMIGSGNLYTYLTTHPNSGFYVCGGNPCIPLNLNLNGLPTSNNISCTNVLDNLLQSLYQESGLSGTTSGCTTYSTTFSNSLSNLAFTSNWLHFHTTISDPNIINLIANKKIKISLKVNHTCSDICILIDNIKLDKVCTLVKESNIFVTSSPGFEIEKIRDNKKSWLEVDTLTNRNFKITDYNGYNAIRQTNYDLEDERLVLNSKEIDLDISLASAIETDAWCYIVDNPCLLTGFTNCDPCGYKQFQDGIYFEFMDNKPYDFQDEGFVSNVSQSTCCGDNYIEFNNLMTQPLSAVTTVEDFEYYITSELIDAKNRQTISGYATLRALYDRYLNSLEYCGTKSSAFDYLTIDQFSDLVGNYWVDIIEQVVPATTIWGSVKIYSNTIFDQQKFKYKAYSSIFCDNPFYGNNVLSPIDAPTGFSQDVEVIMTTINLPTTATTCPTPSAPIVCNKIWVTQMNAGSEFIGTVSLFESKACAIPNNSAINECTLQVNVLVENYTATANLIGAATPVTIEWSNGGFGQTITFSGAGQYSVTVIDANCCSVTTEFDIPIVKT